MENILDFYMDFDVYLNNWSYKIENGYLQEIHVSEHFCGMKTPSKKKFVKLNSFLISKLEEIKEKYDSNDVYRIYEVDKLLKDFE